MNKKLIIIAGVTGSIGQELLRKYLLEENVLIYGISRKGVPISELTILPNHHLIVGVDLSNTDSINEFVSKLPDQLFERISYFHLVGEFKTEINTALEVEVENDMDGDGIDDGVYTLVAKAYKDMTSALGELSSMHGCALDVVSFGSLADQHTIGCFTSFRKSRALVREFSAAFVQEHPHANIYPFNTSTILAADEMLERPFIFATNVNPKYWITPAELVERTLGFMQTEKGFVEQDIYLPNPNFSDEYFNEDITYKRRVKELYNKSI